MLVIQWGAGKNFDCPSKVSYFAKEVINLYYVSFYIARPGSLVLYFTKEPSLSYYISKNHHQSLYIA